MDLGDIEIGVLPKIGTEQRLTRVWGRTVALGWTLIAVALITVGASSQVIGRPMLWFWRGHPHHARGGDLYPCDHFGHLVLAGWTMGSLSVTSGHWRTHSVGRS
jgi:hypothetical protein